MRAPRSANPSRRGTSKARAAAFGQLDLIQQSYSVCPACAGTGKRLFSVEVRVISRGADWLLMRENSKAFGTWDKLDVGLRELIEKKCKRASWKERDRVYVPCHRCRGSGRLTPEVEAQFQHCERLAAAFYRSRGWVMR